MVPAGRPHSFGSWATSPCQLGDSTMKTLSIITAAIFLGLSGAAMANGQESQQSYTNNGNPYAFAPCFDAAGQIYYPTSDSDCHARYPTAGNAYGFVPSTT